ncbi:MAG: 16S rRNA (uracil(1498)-N(3))-methyltransferase [Gammaproteobacteria bacterium]|nr:16S rRNA (uracil(1498)-N(3))-methyltransferase [Gammaproteobacteria bacterium]
MRIPRIYQDTELNNGARIQLDAASSHHLVKVLRVQDGASIVLFNGNGNDYQAVIDIQKRQAFALIQSSIKINTESGLALTLLLGISKGDRMDISIQKSVELGVHKIIPVVTQRTVVNLKHDRGEKKLNHWQGIIINACEQSGRSRIPELAPITRLEDHLSIDASKLKLILDPYADKGINTIQYNNENISFLIGPEGGLSDEEIKLAMGQGFYGIRMGPRILRTETAAITAISVMQALWGDFN